MKTWNVIIKKEKADQFDVSSPNNEGKFVLPLYKSDATALNTNIEDLLKRKSISLTPIIDDFLSLSLSVYTTDQLISRDADGYLGWSRHIKLFLPVSDCTKWKNVSNELQKLLSFLSGDIWELNFRHYSYVKINNNSAHSQDIINNRKNSTVSLFSGGLDSFIGAIDLVKKENGVCLVSHHKQGAPELEFQRNLFNLLKNNYPKVNIELFDFFVQPINIGSGLLKENSSRARSLLFISLGLIIANSISNNKEIIVPENGLISLNIPLTNTRLGSHSTRTTHPYFISVFNFILNKLDIGNQINNPYQFYTKGEMFVNCKDQDFFKKYYSSTLSCAHPDAARWSGKSPNMHCGYCTPCIIRRASIKRAGIIDSKYVHNLTDPTLKPHTKKGSDLRAFKIALERIMRKDDKSLLFEILSSGPLPNKNRSEILKYIELYKRGMKEVEELLK